MRGLKCKHRNEMIDPTKIASLTDARIEIFKDLNTSWNFCIASLTDARIEIYDQHQQKQVKSHRIPHGCADWNRLQKRCDQRTRHRIPHGCADWNWIYALAQVWKRRIASLTDARIEMIKLIQVTAVAKIASLTDARIEIIWSKSQSLTPVYRIPHGCADWNFSVAIKQFSIFSRSHPSRMRGLKLLRISRLLNLQWIASLTDARIEIRLSSALVRSCVRIASLTDARIEINNKQGKPTNSLNRIPHGCADWNL